MLTLKVDPYNDDLADDEDLMTSVDSKDPKRTAYIVRAVNAHEILDRFARDMCEHADEATREYARAICGKLDKST